MPPYRKRRFLPQESAQGLHYGITVPGTEIVSFTPDLDSGFHRYDDGGALRCAFFHR